MDPWLEFFARANLLHSSDTAHDLKTPLNVAVLNLELLRMRIRKLLAGAEDEKVAHYARAMEIELRRMARIFDTFFLLSTPPKEEDAPALIDVSRICTEAGEGAGYELRIEEPLLVRAHESRIREAFKLFFEGASRVFKPENRVATTDRDTHVRVTIMGQPHAADFEPTKVFKFYYTDPLGNADLSLAAARLIAETYGGELIATEDRGKVSMRMSLPLGRE